VISAIPWILFEKKKWIVNKYELYIFHFTQLIYNPNRRYTNWWKPLDQGCQTWIELVNPTGLTENRVEIRFFKQAVLNFKVIP